MNNHAAHTRSWETFEAVYGSALILSLLLNYLIPLQLSLVMPRTASLSSGAILAGAGVAIVMAVRRQFNQAGQPTDPGRPTTQIITTGVFSWSRNPLYLGGLIFMLGIAALLNSIWLLILLLPATTAAHFILILPEEKYLLARFGGSYRQYTRSVRRWFGRRRQP